MSTLGDYIHLNYENYQKYGLTRKEKQSNNGMALIEQQKNNFKNKLANKRIQSNYKQLENFYNDMLYNSESKAHKDMETFLYRELSEMVAKWQIDLTNGLGVNIKSFKFGEIKGFHYNNIVKLKKVVDQTLKNLQEVSKTNRNLEQLSTLLMELEQQSMNLEKTGKYNDFISYLNYSNLRDPITKINELLSGLTAVGRSQAMGTAFEYSLLTADNNFNDYINTVSNDLIKKGITAKEKDQIKFQGLDSHNLELINTIKKTKTNFKDDELEIIGDGTGINTSSTYKMDVILKYGDEEYQISAKNYQLKNFLDIHLVQGRPLLMVLLGNLDISTINHTLNIICSSGSPKSNQQVGYDVIKTIVRIDALVGSAQKKGFVDTLVINNRTKSKVSVIPIPLIVQQLNDIIKITPSLEDRMAGINKRFGGKDSPPSWINSKRRVDNLLAELHKIKMSVSLDYTKLNF